MATITLTFPDAVATRIVDALCAYGGWTAQSPGTRANFAKNEVGKWMKTVTKHYEETAAAATAGQAALQTAETDIAIT